MGSRFGRRRPLAITWAVAVCIAAWAGGCAASNDPPGIDGLVFTESARSVGLTGVQASDIDGRFVQFGGAAVDDVDGDGDDDVYLTRVGLPNQMFLNDGGAFTDVAPAWGLDVEDGSSVPVFADIDGDDDLDLFVAGHAEADHLLFVNSDGVWTDEAVERGIIGDEALALGRALNGDDLPRTHGATFHDWDEDGDLDLLLADWWPHEEGAQVNPRLDVTFFGRLLANDGGGRFTDVTEAVGLDFSRTAGFTPLFADIDGDGWDDLLMTADGRTSSVHLNRAGEGFAEVTDTTGADRDANGMGAAVGDLDGDGKDDWLVTGVYLGEGCVVVGAVDCSVGNRLYRGLGGGEFVDSTDEWGVIDGGWGWGVAMVDVDLDGDLDVVQTNGYDAYFESDEPIWEVWRADTNRLWLNRGAAPLEEVAAAVGFDDPGSGKAVVPFDVEGDGDVDLLITRTGRTPALFVNGIESSDWLDVRLRDPNGGNTRGVGARVVLETADGRSQSRMIRSGATYQGHAPMAAHFAVPADVRELRVEWPDGQTQVVDAPMLGSRLVVERASS